MCERPSSKCWALTTIAGRLDMSAVMPVSAAVSEFAVVSVFAAVSVSAAAWELAMIERMKGTATLHAAPRLEKLNMCTTPQSLNDDEPPPNDGRITSQG